METEIAVRSKNYSVIYKIRVGVDGRPAMPEAVNPILKAIKNRFLCLNSKAFQKVTVQYEHILLLCLFTHVYTIPSF